MNYSHIQEVIILLGKFESEIAKKGNQYSKDIDGFKRWIADGEKINSTSFAEPEWEGKEDGRSPESVINTLISHMNRFAKTYSKSAIQNSEFSRQEEFIYLINLKALGAMTKMELIKKNIQEKPAGILIINRLIQQGWVEQTDSQIDKRSKIITITEKGLKALDKQMDKIRQATQIVTGDLGYQEKMELIKLLNKLNDFHQPIFAKNMDSSDLLITVMRDFKPSDN